MFARLARGFGYAWRGLSHLAGRPNLWKFAALPVILNTLLFIVAGWAYVHFFPDLLHKIMHRPEVWYLWIVYVLVIVLLLVAFALLVLFTFTMVGCALAGPFLDLLSDRVEQQLGRVEAIINSMTPYEREHHESINGSRRKRIARGSGTSVQEINQLLRQYAQMRKMFKSMGKPSFARRLAGMKMPGM